MAFFLLGRVDDTLSLLCPNTFSSRQDAMVALSSVTAEPGFDLWDAEVLLLDTDSGTPVLLMRPQVATTEAVAEPEVLVVDELDPDVVEVEDATSEAFPADSTLAGEVAVDDEPSIAPVEVVPEPEVLVEVEPEETPEVEAGVELETVVTVEEDTTSDAISGELETEEPDAAGALRDALVRTAAQMEADGIVAPESIGTPVPDSDSNDTTPSVDQEWPWDVAPETEPPVAPEIAFVLGELEEPSLDDGSILRGSIDDDTFAAVRPVIMGSYAGSSGDIASEVLPDDDLPVEPMGLTDLEPPTVSVPARSGFEVPVVSDASDIIELEAPVVAEDQVFASDTPDDSPVVDDENPAERDISDFILDLDTTPVADSVVEPVAEAVIEAPQVFDDMPGVVENTCDDCIYEDTCPNRDQRLPKDCGSFSWR